MSKQILEAKLAFVLLLVQHINEAADNVPVKKPYSLKHFLTDESTKITATLINGDRLPVSYECHPDAVNECFNITVTMGCEDEDEYGSGSLTVVMNTEMLAAYKHYMQIAIDVAIFKEVERVKLLTTNQIQ